MAVARVTAAWRGFSASFRLEVRTALRSPVVHWLGWCFPVLLFILLGSIFSVGTMQDLPVSAIDNDHSTLSRDLIRKLDAGSHARIVPVSGGLEEALQRLRSAQDYGLLYIPVDFEAQVLAGRQPRVIFYYNALFYGAGLYSTQDFSTLMAEFNDRYRGIIAAQSGDTLPALADVGMAYGSLFNASGSYVYYQQFAATIHLIQLFAVTCMIYVLERSKDIVNRRPFAPAMLGKLAPYTLCYTLLLLVEMAVLVWVSDAHINGNPLYMLLVGFFYVMAAQSIGVLLFTFTRTALTAYTMMGIIVSIALTFSGLAVPELSMPLPARIIAQIEPLTHALYAMFDIFLRQVSLFAILGVCCLLSLYPLATGLLVRNRLYQRLSRREEGP
ncbi:MULTISPECIES: ABC transporter permease [Brenneria]|uniref:ABC transporter permease n=1 Tax=Brenneria nigrifluens DSM 30175 = ATCC 13028 TaxID=1121120 RepID=A0A2U1URE3_9GAMM|nr:MULTISPECIES: ABC transporter permease [Brenneria]EHD23136.1 ABC-2 type transporter [Brenneria sp. EniD312]PWC24227.1 ABC transporter permease [Brenneria nigrifluens] [Brenneria nigrifluens DSM 30175 = ATCC 13028]QCR06018.1 ABC transporter permease [Brenneria nigrifluens] [Brenneria nigrifluens DSM 30175 = ATCC 13028]